MVRTLFGRPRRAVAFDLAVSGWVATVALASSDTQPGGWLGGTVGLGMALLLLARRARPSAVAVGVWLLTMVQVAAGWGPSPYDVAVLVAMYSVVKYAERLRDGIIAAAGVTVLILLAASALPAPWWESVIYLGLVSGGAFLVALNLRTRRLYVRTLEERAVTLERERDALARAAVAEERARIARELHDIVAHSLAVMIVQADGARYTFDRNPVASRNAIQVVADTGRQALEEMRRLVCVLREPDPVNHRRQPTDADGVPVPAERLSRNESAELGARSIATDPEHRRPAVGELDALLDRSRAAGLVVRHLVRGEPVELPAGVELTVYRLVQEALTNALKHAGTGASVEVTLDYQTPGVIGVRIVDDGRGEPVSVPASSGGHGLVGMRERTAVYGGSIRAGAAPHGGWEVSVHLPLPSVSKIRLPSEEAA